MKNIPDFPAVQKLARALWHEGTARGAAVLVGAGFSKNADRPARDTPEPPLWWDFARDMAAQLYPSSPQNIPSDPLRLAEEYRTYFGQAGLDEFVRIRICDAAWQPGPLHHALLNLEWSDVLTTNWDTLLERAADNIGHRHYDRVLGTADLAHTTSPRIIKLHGSLRTTEHFIIAEEDYRTYPVKFAAFVNLARQIFIENELCLLGFSGDDPNFLQWSGWVRDNLGGSARRIYLAGVLDLSPAKRKFLEARNIAPIDLGAIVPKGTTDRHSKATRLFLDFLAAARPKPRHDWRPASLATYTFLPSAMEDHQRVRRDASYAASVLEQAARIWQKDRESYPGWLICPASRRGELLSATTVVPVTQAIIGAVPDDRREAIVYEIFWRYRAAFGEIDGRLASLFANFADPATASGPSRERCCEIALMLLRRARQFADEEAFGRWVSIIETHSEPGTDLRAEVAYQKALYARDRLDFSAAAREAGTIEGVDPVWPLKRAALLVELGEFEQAHRLVSETVAELSRRQRMDRGSLWLRSRRAWAEWVARATRQDQLSGGEEPRWTLEFLDAHCDPEEETDRIRNNAAAAMRERSNESKPTIPLFQAGHYRDALQTVHLQGAAAVEPLEALESMMETAGLPMRFHHVTFVGAAARDAAELAFEPSFRWHVWFLRAIGSPLEALFGRNFGRVAIAQLPGEVATILSERARAAILYWRERTADVAPLYQLFAFEQVRLFMEVLARITVRQEPAVARANLDLAANLASYVVKGASLGHLWLYEPLGHLVDYSIETIPPAGRQPIVLPMLEFPLSEDRGAHPFQWPNPIKSLWTISPGRVMGDVRWSLCVAHLIERAKAGSPERREAIVRLAYLAKHNALTAEETEAFGQVLWSETDEANAGLPANADLLASMFVELPAPPTVDRHSRVRAYLFDCDIQEILSPSGGLSSRDIGNRLNHLLAITATIQGPLRPTADQAVRMFDTIVRWRPSAPMPTDPIGASLLRPLRENARRTLGEVLRTVATPSLRSEDRTSERARALLTLLCEVPGTTAAGALPYFLGEDEGLRAEIVGGIQQAISGRTDEEVAGGVMAVEQWAAQAASAAAAPFPPQLPDRLISAIESRRQIGMRLVLGGLRQPIVAGMLSEDDRARVSRMLGDLMIEQQYERVDPDSREAVSVSLVRAECVRLARALEDAGTSNSHTAAWLAAASADPLPEVRFALTNDD